MFGKYQLELALSGELVRGGLCVGNVFADEYFVDGPALIEAYELESEVAVVPRVVLSPIAAGVALEDRSTMTWWADGWQDFVLFDSDGRLFVNYLVLGNEETLAVHRDSVEQALEWDCCTFG